MATQYPVSLIDNFIAFSYEEQAMGLDDSEVQLLPVEVLKERERTPSCSPPALTSSPRMLKALEFLPSDKAPHR